MTLKDAQKLLDAVTTDKKFAKLTKADIDRIDSYNSEVYLGHKPENKFYTEVSDEVERLYNEYNKVLTEIIRNGNLPEDDFINPDAIKYKAKNPIQQDAYEWIISDGEVLDYIDEN